MKYLILCEGTNEKTILELLLKHDKLIFKQNDLIGLEIYHARQLVPYLTSIISMYNNSSLKIIRIGDKLNEKLRIPKEITHLIKKENILKCLTKPELEMLLIIDAKLFSKYNKIKSKIKPKIFAKENIKLNNKFYDCSCEFWLNYYENNISKLIKNIKECKKLTKINNKDEIYLADLLK